jgi:hypothetical protein
MPACNDGASGVGISASENELSCAGLRERATDAAIGSTILDRAREVRVLIIAADRQFPTTKENTAVTFHRTDSHPGSGVAADVQAAVPENLHAGSAASGSIDKVNQTARGSAAPAIRYEGGVACVGTEKSLGVERSADRTAVSGNQGVASSRACVEYDGRATCTANFATFVEKSRIASCRSVEECQFAVIAEGGIASARATCKNDSSRVCKRS